MQAWLAQAIARRPLWFLLANAAIAVAAGALTAGAADRLVVGGGIERGERSEQALVLTLTPRGAVTGPVAKEALVVIESGLLADPAVTRVRAGRPARSGAVKVTVTVGGATALERQQAAERVAEQIDPGPFRVEAAGQSEELAQAREEVADELPRLALLAAPFVVLVLGLAFGLRLFAAPILAGATALAGAIAVLRLLPASLDLTASGLAVAAACALTVAVESCWVVRSAHRRAAFDAQEAMIAQTLNAALPRVGWGAAGAALAALALFAIPLTSARSAAIAGIAAVLVAAISAPVATAGLIALAPPRPPERAGVTPEALPGPLRWGRFGAISDEIAIRPWLAWIPVACVVGGAAVLAYPAFDAEAIALAGQQQAAAGAAELFRSRLAWVLAAITVAGVCAALLATRSARLAIARGMPAALPAAAACGLVALIGDEGFIEIEALGDRTYASTLLALAAALGAVAVARGALADRGGAVLGTLVAGAGLGVLAGVEVDAVSQLGLAIATGLLLDLVLVRLLVVPCLERALPDRFRR